jgi:hypothetical protein
LVHVSHKMGSSFAHSFGTIPVPSACAGTGLWPPLPLCSRCLCLVLGHKRWALISPEQQTGQQQSIEVFM